MELKVKIALSIFALGLILIIILNEVRKWAKYITREDENVKK